MHPGKLPPMSAAAASDASPGDTGSATTGSSPWRPIFEEVRAAVGDRRDDIGVLGSINWLRHAMQGRGANPNVVRNIIYRDKGKLPDKRALFEILDELWRTAGNGPLDAPALRALLAPGAGAEQEVLMLLGREKRRAYKLMVAGVRAGEAPKVLVAGKPGSGKTLLADYVQNGLELAPRGPERIVRLEFGGADLATSLTRLGVELGVPAELMESRLVRIDTASAYAVQADAQAEVARIVLDAARHDTQPTVLLLHVSQSIAGQAVLGLAPLRLNTPEVPRVTASEWLWVTLLEPLARLPHMSMLVSMSDVPARALQRLGSFEGPIKLSLPTAAEARRFVKARVPQLPASQHDEIVQRAGRSFEELRTLTLLAQAREPRAGEPAADEHSIEQLSRLAGAAGDADTRAFLSAVAVLSTPEFPGFAAGALCELRGPERGELTPFELSFLDPVPGQEATYRCFSRQLARAVQARLADEEPERYRELHRAAAMTYQEAAAAEPHGEPAARYLHHLFEARDWDALADWLAQHGTSHAMVRRVWAAAVGELVGSNRFEVLAREIANHYVKLGAFDHPDAVRAFEALAASEDQDLRAWTAVKRAEGEVVAGQFERAQVLLDVCPATDVPLIRAELALARASVLRWRGELDAAAHLVRSEARAELDRLGPDEGSAARMARAKAAVWAGLIAKDRGDLTGALTEFDRADADDDLVRARIAFQRGDVARKLGCFDRAIADLDDAVALARRSEALPQELARYLARRGTILRLQGDLTASAAAFAEARAKLRSADLDETERAFQLAKVDDEGALTALADGAFETATFALTHALAAYRTYALDRGVDAGFRLLRGALRLASAYAGRGLSLPLRPPLPLLRSGADGPDLRHARARIDEILQQLRARKERYDGGLLLDALIHASYFAENAELAMRHAQAALDVAEGAYARARALTTRAQAHLRSRKSSAALRDLDDARAALLASIAHVPAYLGPGDDTRGGTRGGRPAGQDGDVAGGRERGDPGLRAQIASFATAAHLKAKRADDAAASLAKVLEDPTLAPYHEGSLRAFGEVAEDTGVTDAWKRHHRLRSLLGLDGTGPTTPARLPDALVASWRSRRA